MTAEQKRERREVKHKLQKAVLANHFQQWKFKARNNQLKQGCKRVADQLLSGRNPASVMVKVAA